MSSVLLCVILGLGQAEPKESFVHIFETTRVQAPPITQAELGAEVDLAEVRILAGVEDLELQSMHFKSNGSYSDLRALWCEVNGKAVRGKVEAKHNAETVCHGFRMKIPKGTFVDLVIKGQVKPETSGNTVWLKLSDAIVEGSGAEIKHTKAYQPLLGPAKN